MGAGAMMQFDLEIDGSRFFPLGVVSAMIGVDASLVAGWLRLEPAAAPAFMRGVTWVDDPISGQLFVSEDSLTALRVGAASLRNEHAM